MCLNTEAQVEFAGAFEGDGEVGMVEEELARFGPTEFRFCDELFDVRSLVMKDALVKGVAFDVGAKVDGNVLGTGLQ